ncbi:type II secretion system protein [Aeromonas veronii]|uniref:type II secretion system protein n=1 Tax=Aeromonas veronii TaxID=654 RepID=UPI001C5B7716|nr:type II secretion system protein [Aeromonas veronii]MBW3779582.1 type II secretion system protein [Aeromonas veronii]
MKMNRMNSQRGMIEFSMMNLLVLIAAIGLLTAILYPSLKYSWDKSQFVSQYQMIRKAAESYKGGNINFTGVSIAALCAEEHLKSKSEICVRTATSNAFGGSWTVTPATNPAMTVITATAIPSGNGANLQRDMENIAESAVFSGQTLTITQ